MPQEPKNQTTSAPASERVITSLRQLQGRQFHQEYLLEEVIGEGAMGVVFRAVQQGLGRKVALKLMKGDVLKDRGEVLERFQAEIKLVSGLSHPNIVRFFDSGYEPRFGVYYVAMELIEGLCLGDLLRTHRCHPSLALEVTAQICRGLTEPHKLGVVHRDLKPDNIFLRLRSDGQLEVKILDFGIACALHNNARITRTGMLMGTPAYMAPELAISSPIDTRTDLYALGIMLFEMLTGDVPHQDDTPIKILMRHIHSPVTPLGSIDPELEIPTLQNLLDALLQKASKDRPASALSVCEAIEAIQQAQGLELAKLNPHGTIESAIEPLVTRSDQTKAVLHRIQSGQLIGRPNHTDPTHALLPQGPNSLAEESDANEAIQSIEVFESTDQMPIFDPLVDQEPEGLTHLPRRRGAGALMALLCGLVLLGGLGFFLGRPTLNSPPPKEGPVPQLSPMADATPSVAPIISAPGRQEPEAQPAAVDPISPSVALAPVPEAKPEGPEASPLAKTDPSPPESAAKAPEQTPKTQPKRSPKKPTRAAKPDRSPLEPQKGLPTCPRTPLSRPKRSRPRRTKRCKKDFSGSNQTSSHLALLLLHPLLPSSCFCRRRQRP